MYKIIIMMLLIDPLSGKDAVEVTHQHGKVLEFSNLQQCYLHVQGNLDSLKSFARFTFGDDAVVKRIECVKKTI